MVNSAVNHVLSSRNRIENSNGSTPEFCICSKCTTDATDRCKNCCQNHQCVTENGIFEKLISSTNIEVSCILNKSRSNVTPDDLCHCTFRAHAYAAYCNWQMSKDNQVSVPPNCVLSMIRKKYPRVIDVVNNHECHSDTEITDFQYPNDNLSEM